MPRNPAHRLGSVNARLVRAGIELEIAGHDPMILPIDVAKRVAAVLAAALADSRTLRRGC